jgi:hypothetical protein
VPSLPRAERLRAVTEANLKNVDDTDFAGATFNPPDDKQPSIVPRWARPCATMVRRWS